MKLVFDFKKASVGKAHGIALHNARVDGHWESNKAGPGIIGGVRPESSKDNLALVPVKSFKEDSWIKGRKIIGGRQAQAQESEFTTWVIQAGKIDDTLPIESNVKFLKEAHQWLTKKFGAENVRSSHIHLDEATPQLQLVMSNIVEREDGKIYLGMKRTFGYQGMSKSEIRLHAKKLQQDFYDDVAEKYGIEAPSETLGTKGKVSLAQWKLEKNREKLVAKEKTLRKKEHDVKLFEYFDSKNGEQVVSKMVKALDKYNPTLASAAKAAFVEVAKENMKKK